MIIIFYKSIIIVIIRIILSFISITFYIGNLSINNFHNNDQIKDINILTDNEKSHKNKNLDDPFEMYKIFKNPIKRILSAKSLFTKNFDKKILNKMEFNYLKNELNKNGINIYNLLYGCLDSISDIDDEN